MIRVEIAGLDAVEKHLQEVPRRVERRVLLDMAQIIYDHAERAADRHTRTGALRQSLYNRPIPHGREIGHDPQRAPHALFVHWGTRPHVIKPKKRKALRWTSGGEFVFAKFVRHPGYKGDAYLVDAAREAIRRMPEIVARAMKGG